MSIKYRYLGMNPEYALLNNVSAGTENDWNGGNLYHTGSQIEMESGSKLFITTKDATFDAVSAPAIVAAPRTTTTVTNCSTSGPSTTVVTTQNFNTAGITVGAKVTGTGITGDVYVTAVVSNTEITVDTAVTVAAATTLTFDFEKDAVNRKYADLKVAKTGDTMTGSLLINNNGNLTMDSVGTGTFTTGTGAVSINGSVTIANTKTLSLGAEPTIGAHATTKTYVDGFISKAGGVASTMAASETITLGKHPTLAFEAATKQYVDDQLGVNLNAGNGLTSDGSSIHVGSSARIVVNADNIDLAASGVSPGTYNNVTVDTYGRVTGASNASYALSNHSHSYLTSVDHSHTLRVGLNEAYQNSGSGDTYGNIILYANGFTEGSLYLKNATTAGSYSTPGGMIRSVDVKGRTTTHSVMNSNDVTTALTYVPRRQEAICFAGYATPNSIPSIHTPWFPPGWPASANPWRAIVIEVSHVNRGGFTLSNNNTRVHVPVNGYYRIHGTFGTGAVMDDHKAVAISINDRGPSASAGSPGLTFNFNPDGWIRGAEQHGGAGCGKIDSSVTHIFYVGTSDWITIYGNPGSHATGNYWGTVAIDFLGT